MTKSGANDWILPIANFRATDQVVYWFTYEKSGLAFDSAKFNFPTAVLTAPSNDFSIQLVGGRQISFTSHLNSAWVDVHYQINGGGQQNFRMTSLGGNNWVQNKLNLRAGDQLRVWFTYQTPPFGSKVSNPVTYVQP
jgi:hypothetical protein